MDAGGDRRVLTLANPGLHGLPFATPTLSAAYQTLAAHEAAPAHRHTPAALRFILHGSGVTTTVDGDVIEMNAGDLILTPSWTYHDHTNDTDDTMTWFDGLDVPLVRALDAVFFQNHPEVHQPISTVGQSEARYGYAGLSPTDAHSPTRPSPLLVYRWANTDAALESILRSDGEGVAALDFTDPVSGGPALATIGCHMLRLRSGATTAPSRQTGSRVMVVYRGSGQSRVGDTSFDWEPGDVIAVPSWSVLHHRAHTDADIFLMSDEPVLRSLRLFREEVLTPEQQRATADID
jgi:gentisate 1,2-dioxygenase